MRTSISYHRRQLTLARRGFTLIELLVVVTLIGLLASLAVPRYFSSIERGKRTVQAQNVHTIRDSIDKFYADNGRYPASLEELVSRRYLRAMPIDPVTMKSDWVVIPPPVDAAPGLSVSASPAEVPPATNPGGVYDVRSSVSDAQP